MTALMLGGCQCVAVRFSSTGKARKLYVCHCRECQKSASAFGISLQVPRVGFDNATDFDAAALQSPSGHSRRLRYGERTQQRLLPEVRDFEMKCDRWLDGSSPAAQEPIVPNGARSPGIDRGSPKPRRFTTVGGWTLTAKLIF